MMRDGLRQDLPSAYRPAGILVRLFTVLVTILGLAAGCTSSQGLAPPPSGTERVAPPVTLTTANGTFNLAAQRGKVVVLFFSFVG